MFSTITLSMTFSKFNKTNIHHQFSRTYPWIEIQDSMSNLVISSTKRTRKFFYHFFCALHTTSWILSAIFKPKLSNQCFLDMLLTLKNKTNLWRIHGLSMYDLPSTNKTKQHGPFYFLFPNLPQIQSMNHIVMKIGSIQGFSFWFIKLLKYIHTKS